jgi:hypothetical protein
MPARAPGDAFPPPVYTRFYQGNASSTWRFLGNVACGSVRNSRRLRLRPLQPFLPGLLLGFQPHASYLCLRFAVALHQPFCSMTDHSVFPPKKPPYRETAPCPCGLQRAKASGVKIGHKTKLTPHQRQEILRRKENGEAVREIARSYNVHNSTISRLAA